MFWNGVQIQSPRFQLTTASRESVSTGRFYIAAGGYSIYSGSHFAGASNRHSLIITYAQAKTGTTPNYATIIGKRSATTTPASVRRNCYVLNVADLVNRCGVGRVRRAIHSPFIYDDQLSVIENPSIVRLQGGTSHVGPLTPPKDLPTSGRPLVNLSLALNYHFGTFDTAGYHVFNLIVHLLSALLLMAIVQRTLRLDYFGGRFDRASRPLAFIVALLWAVHPLQTETVIYITQRTELLVSFFYLATLYGSLRYWAAASRAVRTAWLIFSMLACLAGMACKEVMVSAPLIALLFERTFLAGSFRQALRKSWPLYIGLAIGWGLLLGLNFGAPRAHSAGFHLEVPAYVWWLTQTKVLWMYLKLALWPWPLSIHYQMPYLTTLGAAWPWLLPATLAIIATLVLLWRRSAVGFVGVWVLAILSPTLLIPIVTEVAAERRMYLPLAALLTLVVVGIYALAQFFAGKLQPAAVNNRSDGRWPMKIAAAVALILVLVFSLVSAHRLVVYHDSITLWQDVLASHPEDPEAHNNLGLALANENWWPQALDQYQQALQLKTNYPTAHYNLANALVQFERFAEAIDHYQQALRLYPDFPAAHNNLGNVLSRIGRTDEAIDHYQHALQLKPNYADAYNNLGNALLHTGRPQEAAAQYEQALRFRADDADQVANLAQAYAAMHRPTQAIAAAEKAAALAHSQGQTARAGQIEAWLTNYRSQQSQTKETLQ